MRSLRRTTTAVVRSELQLSLSEFARLIGKSPSTIQALEAGSLKLSEKTGLAISKKTGVQLNWLLDGDPKSSPLTSEGTPWSRRHFEKRLGQISQMDKIAMRTLIMFHAAELKAIIEKQRNHPDNISIIESRVHRFLKELRDEFGADEKIIEGFFNKVGKTKFPQAAEDLLDYYGLHRHTRPKK